MDMTMTADGEVGHRFLDFVVSEGFVVRRQSRLPQHYQFTLTSRNALTGVLRQ